MIRIVVGSRSALKLQAVRDAVAQLGLTTDVIGIDALSRVPMQPYGWRETMEGARNRAAYASGIDPSACTIGIENGLVPEGERLIDLACVVLLTPDGRMFVRRSEAVRVPPNITQIVHVSDRRCVTAGDIQARSGGDPADPHRVWSEGRTDRKTLLVAAVRDVLLPAFHRVQGEKP